MSAKFSFGPCLRVKKRSDFLRIQGTGQKFRSKNFLLIVSVNKLNINAPIRIGITITTKVDKKAARRNRLRRRIREIFRLKQMNMNQGLDLVVVCLNGSTELSFEEVKAEISYLFKKARITKEIAKMKP